MRVKIKPDTWTKISDSSCTISASSKLELVRFKEGNKNVAESYLNTPLTILTNSGLHAKSYQKEVYINIQEL